MHSEIAIDIAASAELVFRLARDPLRWPALLPHYVRAREIDREGHGLVAEYVARRPLVPLLGIDLPVVWRSRSWSEPSGRRLRFHHLGGATGGMDVTWRIESTELGCRVTIEHMYGPMFAVWVTLVEQLFVRPIAGRTLATFKALAEAIEDAQIESAGPARTKASV